MVENLYDNVNYRRSFSIMMLKCNDSHSDVKCASDEEITTFLDNFYYTIYAVTDKVIFDNANVDFQTNEKFFS